MHTHNHNSLNEGINTYNPISICAVSCINTTGPAIIPSTSCEERNVPLQNTAQYIQLKE